MTWANTRAERTTRIGTGVGPVRRRDFGRLSSRPTGGSSRCPGTVTSASFAAVTPEAPTRSPEVRMESLVVSGCDAIAADGVILSAARRDLERAQGGRETPGALPVPALDDPVQEPGTERIAAARRLD